MHPDAREAAPVGLEVALRVAPEAARHPGERLAADELADLARADERAAVVVDDVHRHPERRPAERARLDRHRRHRREEARADLGAARAVDDRHARPADVLEQPAVRARGSTARRSSRTCAATTGRRVGSPCGSSARTSVGERPSEVTRSCSTVRQSRSARPVGRALGEDDRRAERAAPTTVHGPMIQPRSVAKWTTSPAWTSAW